MMFTTTTAREKMENTKQCCKVQWQTVSILNLNWCWFLCFPILPQLNKSQFSYLLFNTIEQVIHTLVTRFIAILKVDIAVGHEAGALTLLFNLVHFSFYFFMAFTRNPKFISLFVNIGFCLADFSHEMSQIIIIKEGKRCKD